MSETAPEVRTGPRAVLHVVRQRNFLPFFIGNAVSSSGTWFLNLAASVLVYRLTGSELLLGVLNVSQFAAILLLAPWTGSAADRFDRRKLTIAMQGLSAIISGILATLAFLGHAGVVVVIVASLVLGVASAFSIPAQMALVTSLVEPRDIPTAVQLNSMAFNIARAAGPVLAAGAIVWLGIPAAFALNSLSYLALIAALLVVTPRHFERPSSASLLDSFRLVRRRPRLVVLLLVVMAAGFVSDPVNTLAPAFAVEFGHRDVVGGYLVGAFGAGAIVAAFVIAGREITRRRLIFGLLVSVFGMIALSLAPWIGLALVCLFLVGFGYLAANSSATARLQLEVDESERGRIMTLWSMAFLGFRPVASFADGAIASVAGVRTAGLALSVPALLAAGVLLWRERRGIEVPPLPT